MNRRPILVVGGAIVVAMTLLSIWAWFQLPPGARVPIHFGITGTANGYADKTLGLFLLPAISAMVLVVRVIIPAIEPRRANLARSGPAYTAILLAILGFLFVIHALAIADALGTQLNIVPPVLIGTGVLFLVVGNYLPKVRSSFLFGIRTPWTLTSELAWSRTHRLGGRLFALFGFVLIGAALIVPPGGQMGLLVGGVILISAVLAAYSYVMWRADPEHRTLDAPRVD